jgi:glycolate oxidase
MEDAANTVSAIISAKIIPCTLEFLDRVTINCVDYAAIGLPRVCISDPVDGNRRASGGCRRRSAPNNRNRARVARSRRKDRPDSRRGPAMATARRAAFSSLARIAPTTILKDATVPRSELARMMEHIQHIAEKYQLRNWHIRTYGRWQSASNLSDKRKGSRRDAPGSNWL